MYTRTLVVSFDSLALYRREPKGTHPIPTAEMKVPKKANVRITPKFLKKFSCPSTYLPCQFGYMIADMEERRTCLSSYPEFRMIGGNNRLKNKVCLNDYQSA